jgi:hypothetical protein
MRRLSAGVVIGIAVLGCAKAPTLHQAQGEPMSDLRAEIASRVAMDQAVQRELSDRIQAGQPIGPASARQDSVFNANLQWVRLILAQYGWPGRRLVGEEGSHGAWLLLQHADRDTALQRTALQLLETAVRDNDASSRDLAYLTDRVRVAEGRLQVYGTQLQYDSRGCASPKPSEEPAQLDARRASVRLEPVAQYVQTVMATLGRASQCAAPKEQIEPRVRLDEHKDSRRTNQRLMIQINDEPPFIRDSESGDAPIMYRGLSLSPDRIKTINVLKAREARQRFGDPTLDSAIFIELK